MAKQQTDPELLKRLGWTPDDLAKFLATWEKMKREAAVEGPRGEAGRQKLDEALRSLGLRPSGTELRGGLKADQMQNMREAGRFAPPPGWEEQFRAYNRGVAGGGR